MDSGPKKLTDLNVLVDALSPQLNAVTVCLSKSWGGLEQVAAQDALDVAELGLKMRVMCLEGSPIHEHLARNPEIGILPLNFRPRNYFDFKMRREVECLLAEGVNLIHTHQTTLLGTLAPWVWRSPSVALLASRHLMNNHNKKNFFHQAIYSRVDALLVMSETLKWNVISTHPVREKQVKVVNLGLDFERFDPSKASRETYRRQWGADDQTTVIGLVGRVDPAKGQATFIRAAAGITKNLHEGERIKFVIVGEETRGSPPGYLDELKEMVRQFHLDDAVVFTGFQEDVPSVMSAFDIFVMPSRQEAFGLVAIEAMAMECPIVISRAGSSEEIVGNNEFGLTVVPEDAFDLQKQLHQLLKDPSERIRMGKRAREHVLRNYDRRTRLRKTLELYERALRKRRSF